MSFKKYASEEYVNEQIATIPAPDVNGQINSHDNDANAHSDIRTELTNQVSATKTYVDTSIDAITPESIGAATVTEMNAAISAAIGAAIGGGY